MTKCSTCGKIVDITAKRCPNCGKERLGFIPSLILGAIISALICYVVGYAIDFIIFPWDLGFKNFEVNTYFSTFIYGIVFWVLLIFLTFAFWTS